MINTQLLDTKINESGLKIGFITDKLGISRQGLYKKIKGKTPFRVAEIYVISDLLRLDDETKMKIFYPES